MNVISAIRFYSSLLIAYAKAADNHGAIKMEGNHALATRTPLPTQPWVVKLDT